MANVNGSNFKRWDTLAGAAFNTTTPPRDPIVRSILITSGLTGGVTTFTVDGQTWWSLDVAANSIMHFEFGGGVQLRGLALSALGTNVVVTVTYV